MLSYIYYNYKGDTMQLITRTIKHLYNSSLVFQTVPDTPNKYKINSDKRYNSRLFAFYNLTSLPRMNKISIFR